MSPSTVEAIRDHRTPKGDPLEISRIAGVMGAKRTSELIPLCHPLPLNQANVEIEILPEGVLITATATTEGKTGVEMEALTAVSISALTIYDMCKAIDKSMVISEIKLESKTGGTSGDFKREQAGEVG
jgi:cyclic pyranopterin phosphate synthase